MFCSIYYNYVNKIIRLLFFVEVFKCKKNFNSIINDLALTMLDDPSNPQQGFNKVKNVHFLIHSNSLLCSDLEGF